MTRRGLVPVLVGALAIPVVASAQEYSVAAVREAHTFDEPAGVGVRRAWMNAILLQAQIPLGESLVAGTRIRQGTAGVESPAGGEGELSGLADTDLWVGIRLGRVELTGVYSLPTGQTELSAGASAARGLSSDMYLSYPLVPWGSGGRRSIEAATRFGPDFALFELRAGTASYGSFQPLADDAFDFRPGSDLFGSLTVAINLGGFTTLDLLAGIRRVGADQVDDVDTYKAGTWVDSGLALSTQAGMTSLIASVLYRSRGEGSAPQVNPGEGFRDPDISFGAFATPSRGVLDARLDMRRPLAWGDVLGGFGARLADQGGGSSSMVTASLGTEVEIAVVQAGRVLVQPVVQAGAGTAVVGRGFESGARHLGGTVTLRWVR